MTSSISFEPPTDRNPPSSAGPHDLHHRALQSIRLAQGNLRRRQEPDGHWAGDYGGPMFLLPMLVGLLYAARELEKVPVARRRGMVAYLSSVVHEDGGVGLHAEDDRGLLFTTVLGYVALRLLGVERGHPTCARMLGFIHRNGGPTGAAPWGKWTLCLLGLYDWEGIHPVPPELWLLPRAVPFHPGRLWCHCRQVYLPMAWLYGKRAVVEVDDLLRSLRDELYAGGWDGVDWKAARDRLSPTDSYRPEGAALRAVNAALGAFERRVPRPLRERALREVFRHVAYEDDVTSGIDIGPVNKVLNGFVHLIDDPRGNRWRRALQHVDDYLWNEPSPSGELHTKMQGYNGSQLWDTAFAIQALLASPLRGEAEDVLERAYGYLRDTQILEDVPNREEFFRHASKGGWPFSTRPHGWPITDCTSEGLKSALGLAGRYTPAIPHELLEESVRLILSWQNDDGGWATYERQRAGAWLEALNPSAVFGDIMVDYSYVECTSTCVEALAEASAHGLGRGERERVRDAIARGAQFLRKAQRADGSFEGSWAVCFTYGTWFGVRGLLASGARPSDEAIQRACSFLMTKQRSDGSWSEDGASCRERRWVEGAEGHVVQTSWALLTLLAARHPNRGALNRAADFLVRRQERSGAWPKEPLVGVFNRTCLIDYDNYRHIFPLWALSGLLRHGTNGA